VHFGRHGTLEWLPGKDVAQQESDPGPVLIGDLPHAYYYLVDGGGEFLQAKRRSSAVVISHLTPLLATAGVPADYRALKESLESHERSRESAPVVAAEHARQAWKEAVRLKLDVQLKLTEDMDESVRMERLESYLHDMEEQAIPLGIHAIGRMPSDPVIRDAVSAYIVNAAHANTKTEILRNTGEWADSLIAGEEPQTDCEPCRGVLRDARDWLVRLRASAAAELESLVAVLAGRYLPSGVSGDPLRVPGALPTGRNLHDQDPRGFPSKAAWAAGQRLSEDLIGQYRKKHGVLPKRVSFVLWYGESGRTQGLREAQAMALLGVRPVWNGRGQVSDVELVSLKELGRSRVDVVLTMSGLYRDGMPEKLPLLDKAVRLVREAAEDNAIQSHTVEVENELIAAGVDPVRARKAARARIFGPQPGVFGVGMAGMMEASRDGGDHSAAAKLYLRNMNYAYGEGLAGEAAPGALQQQLKRNQVVVHGRSSNLYGVLDNDETYQFAGGLNAATKEASGTAPEFLIANARKAGNERYDEANYFLRRELATRLWNEKWIEGMKSSGYAGAQQISKEVEHLYQFRATAPEQVDAEVWQETLDTYIRDKRKLGLDKWFRDVNPHARQMLAARLIEIDRQGVYKYSPEDKRALVEAYVKSVNESGVSCYVNACGNKKLIRHVATLARQLGGVRPETVASYELALQKATSSSRVTAASKPSSQLPGQAESAASATCSTA
jgi:cobaltochelatase CobN